MYKIKKYLLLTILFIFSITIIIPQNVTATGIIQNFNLLIIPNIEEKIISINSNSLSDGLIISGLSKQKQEEFLFNWATELRTQNFSDKQIISIIKSWAEKHKEFFESTENINSNNNKNKLDITESILKSNKFSIRGFFYRIRDSILEHLQKAQEKTNTHEHIKKNMQSNVKFFPAIQLMLGFELAEAFATIFITGFYPLAFLSAVTACLGIISFTTSIATGFIPSKISRRSIVVVSLIVHTLGSISLALVPYSAVFLILSQILPTIGVAGLAVSLSPFFYSSMEYYEKDSEKIKKEYSKNEAFFSIIMALSSLCGGGLVVLFASFGTQFEVIGQHAVVILAVALDVIVTTLAIFKTHKEEGKSNIENEEDETAVFRDIKTNEKGFKAIKIYIQDMLSPLKQIIKDKHTLSFIITNILINNVFFATMTLLLQPVIATLTTNSQLLELYLSFIYGAANTVQFISKKYIEKLEPLLEKPFTRPIFFMGIAGLAFGFLSTSNPLFIVTIFIGINFFYGISYVSETTSISASLPSQSRSQWLALRTVSGLLTATIIQAISSVLISANINSSLIVSVSTLAIASISVIISSISNKHISIKDISKHLKKVTENLSKNIKYSTNMLYIHPIIESDIMRDKSNNMIDDININLIKSILASA